MVKDIIVLRCLRYRFSKILEHVPLNDFKTYNVLNIPPWKEKKQQEEIKVEEVTHD